MAKTVNIDTSSIEDNSIKKRGEDSSSQFIDERLALDLKVPAKRVQQVDCLERLE